MAIDMVSPWDTLNADEKRLFARMAEVYAGFSRVHRRQVGRIIDYLEETGQLENTLDHVRRGQRRLGRGHPERLRQREQVLQRLARGPRAEPGDARPAGRSPETYNHYPTGWAMAFSTPFKMFKRYTYQGGVAIRW